MKLRKYILYSLCFIILYSCEQDNCTRFLDNTAHMQFTSSNTGDDTTINNFSVSKLDIDSLIIEERDSTGMKVPLNQTSDICEFSFKIHYSEIVEDITIEYDIIDTISIFYLREPQYISSGCGFRMMYKLEGTEYTQNNFDSIVIVEPDSLINVDNENQIKIYF